MRQALHIFTKDVRQLWYLIALVLGLTAAFAATSVQPWTSIHTFAPPPETARPLIAPDVGDAGGLGAVSDSYAMSGGSLLFVFLLIIAWYLLIVRVVQAEALVGTRQFWITRPYNRGSLWAAKAMFVLAFVNLPLLVAQAVIIAGDGLLPGSNLPALLWEQALVTAVVLLPAMAIGALTRTATQFVFCCLATAFAFGPGIQLLEVGLAQWGLQHRPGSDFMARETDALAWVPLAAAAATVGAAGIAVLWMQFLRRRTAAARAIAVAGCVGGIAMLVLPPWSAVFHVQSIFTVPPGSLTADFVRPQPRSGPVFGVTDTLALPVRISGLPQATLLACEAASVTIVSGSGGVWNSGPIEYGSRIALAQTGCQMRIEVDHDFFRGNRDQPVLIRGVLYVTLFGHEQTAPLAADSRPVAVRGVGMCRANRGQARWDDVLCRVGFRWPRRLVWARDETGGGPRLTPSLSYSPFPAALFFDPVDNYHTAAPADAHGVVTVVSQEPTAHVRLDAELRDVRLGDLEWGVR